MDVEEARRKRDEARTARLDAEHWERLAGSNADDLNNQAQLAERQAQGSGKTRHEAGAAMMRGEQQRASRSHRQAERDLQQALQEERRAQQTLDAAERDAAQRERTGDREEERER